MRRPSTFCRFRAGRRRRAAYLILLPAVAMALAASMLAAEAGAESHDGGRLVFRPPVDAPVADPFRPPEDPYGPGNRGIEYDTEPGSVVRAAAAGSVVFSGAVAGSLYVTLDHGGGGAQHILLSSAHQRAGRRRRRRWPGDRDRRREVALRRAGGRQLRRSGGLRRGAARQGAAGAAGVVAPLPLTPQAQPPPMPPPPGLSVH